MKRLLLSLLVLLFMGTMAFAQRPQTLLTPAQKGAARLSINHHAGTIYNAKDADTTIASSPYNEGFESGSGHWMAVDVDSDGYNWYIIEGIEGYAHTGQGVAVSESYVNDSALTTNNWFIGPALQLPAGDTLELSWYVVSLEMYPHNSDKYSVYISTTGTDIEDFTTCVYTETLDGVNSYAKKSILLGAYKGQTIHIAFRHYDCTDKSAVLLDDITISAPSAPEVSIQGTHNSCVTFSPVVYTSKVSGITPITYQWSCDKAQPSTGTSRDFSFAWTDTGTCNISLIVTNAYGTDTAIFPVHVVDNSYPTGITAPFVEDFENGHCFYWKTFDLDGDKNTWYSLESLFDTLGAGEYSSYYAHSGSDAMVSWSYHPNALGATGIFGSNLNANDLLISPAIQLPAGQAWKLSFFVSSIGGADNPDDIEVRLATSNPYENGNIATAVASYFTDTIFAKTTITSNTYQQRVFDLSAYAGNTIYLGFIHETDSRLGIAIDDLVINTSIGTDAPNTAVVALYPNPTTGKVSICSEGLQKVQVLDLNGRVLLSCNAGSDNISLNISSLPKGLYLVKVQTGNGIMVRKVVKQ